MGKHFRPPLVWKYILAGISFGTMMYFITTCMQLYFGRLFTLCT